MPISRAARRSKDKHARLHSAHNGSLRDAGSLAVGAGRAVACDVACLSRRALSLRLRVLKFAGHLLQFFKRKQQQLIRVDPFLPRATNLLQQKLDLVMQCGELAIFFFERDLELFNGCLMLRVSFIKQRGC